MGRHGTNGSFIVKRIIAAVIVELIIQLTIVGELMVVGLPRLGGGSQRE
jgi:hypothetical protein